MGKYSIFDKHGEMDLSRVVKLEKNSVYAHRYKHIFDAAQNAPLVIVVGGVTVCVDDNVGLRFNTTDGVKSVFISVGGLLNCLAELEKNQAKYKFSLYGDTTGEANELSIKVD